MTVSSQTIAPRVRAARTRAEVAKGAKQMFGSEQAADLYAASLIPIMNDPKFREKVAAVYKIPPEKRASPNGMGMNATAQLVSAGMARLTESDRDAFADLKLALGTHSLDLCGGFWTGRVRMDDLTAALHQLSEEQKAAWIRISMEALTREVHATSPVVAPSPEANMDAMTALQAALTPEEKVVFERTIQGGQDVTSKDACASFQMVLRGRKALTPPVRATLVRMMIAPEGA